MERFREEFADSPAALTWLEANLTDVDDGVVRDLLEEVDASRFSLRQWVEGMVVLGHWLDARRQRASLVDQIGYVSCASAAAGAGASLSSLPGLVEDMLETYGFERGWICSRFFVGARRFGASVLSNIRISSRTFCLEYSRLGLRTCAAVSSASS